MLILSNSGEYLGLEFGYETTVSATKNAKIGPGSTILGIPIGVNFATYSTKIKLYGYHIGLMGMWPITSIAPHSDFSLLILLTAL